MGLINAPLNNNNVPKFINKMDKNKNEKGNPDYENMSDQKTGSALYIKTHEDFNNEHPEHDDSGLINGNNPNPESNIAEFETKKTGKEINETIKDNNETAKSYTCPMHPEVISDKPGKCPKCGMDLIEKK